ncbi:hypothetical protein [Halobacillus amylolyticus]|uniref:YopX protein domain-containing protein n=1 Tax=Halobacillus amylolyticus TaxID=2932259 RepID=A0ABY4HBB3_9BACI|nr:hypothetical protein [Halobacillus amylolyticus]UOR12190.1 hypothetical protein MUO15_01230 [Halobacillus amylolyticus]
MSDQTYHDLEEFTYNGVEHKATIIRTYIDGVQMGNSVTFQYEGVRVSENFDPENHVGWYNLAQTCCEIIDEHGEEIYKGYSKNRGIIKSIKHSYLVLNDKVYDLNVMKVADYYFLGDIRFKDGKTFDGHHPVSGIFEEDKKSRKKTKDNLKTQSLDYHKVKNVLPEDKYINTEKNNEFQKAKTWIQSNINL